MAGAPRTDFGSWFSGVQNGSIAGEIKPPVSPSAPAASAPMPTSGFSFTRMFAGGATSSTATDVESQQNATTNVFASVGTLLGVSAAPQPAVDDLLCGLSTMQRFQLALLLGGGAAVLFFMAVFVFLPMVVLFPSKFASCMTFGSLLSFAALAILRGPRALGAAVLEPARLPFTGAYVASLALTLYATVIASSYLLVLLSVFVQVCALAYFASSFVPGGTAGMNSVSRFALSAAHASTRSLVSAVVR